MDCRRGQFVVLCDMSSGTLALVTCHRFCLYQQGLGEFTFNDKLLLTLLHFWLHFVEPPSMLSGSCHMRHGVTFFCMLFGLSLSYHWFSCTVYYDYNNVVQCIVILCLSTNCHLLCRFFSLSFYVVSAVT